MPSDEAGRSTVILIHLPAPPPGPLLTRQRQQRRNRVVPKRMWPVDAGGMSRFC